MVVNFQVPSNADVGAYNLVLLGGIECENDTTFVPDAFTVKAAAGIATNDPSAGEITGIRVSPNPAKDEASIAFLVNTPSHVRLLIFDGLGRTVATLCNRNLSAGPQSFEWLPESLPNGGYFYEITTGQEMYGGRIVVRR